MLIVNDNQIGIFSIPSTSNFYLRFYGKNDDDDDEAFEKNDMKKGGKK